MGDGWICFELSMMVFVCERWRMKTKKLLTLRLTRFLLMTPERISNSATSQVNILMRRNSSRKQTMLVRSEIKSTQTRKQSQNSFNRLDSFVGWLIADVSRSTVGLQVKSHYWIFLFDCSIPYLCCENSISICFNLFSFFLLIDEGCIIICLLEKKELCISHLLPALIREISGWRAVLRSVLSRYLKDDILRSPLAIWCSRRAFVWAFISVYLFPMMLKTSRFLHFVTVSHSSSIDGGKIHSMIIPLCTSPFPVRVVKSFNCRMNLLSECSYYTLRDAIKVAYFFFQNAFTIPAPSQILITAST